MNDDNEPLWLGWLLFPFRALSFLADLIVSLALLGLVGGITALVGAFLWLIITGP